MLISLEAYNQLLVHASYAAQREYLKVVRRVTYIPRASPRQSRINLLLLTLDDHGLRV